MSKISKMMVNIISKLKMRRQTMSKKKRIIRITLLLASVVIISASVFVYQIKTNIDKIIIPKTVIPNTQIETEHDTDQLEKENNEDFYALIIGLDYREGSGSLNTDSLMVMHIIPQNSTVKLLSIPRDLLVENKGGNIVKINSLFYEGYLLTQQMAEDNPAILTGNTVQLGSSKIDKVILSGSMANIRNKIDELLDIQIDHTILVNFNMFISLVDEVGGIEIDVKRSMKYKETNLYLEPGLQVLNGEDALGYARFRMDDRGSHYYDSDFQRGERQQEVLKALADEILSWGNSSKVLKLLNIVSDNVKTDMNYSDMYAMIKNYYGDFNGDSFLSVQFPEYYSVDGDVIIPDEALDHLQDAFHSLEDGKIEEAHKDL